MVLRNKDHQLVIVLRNKDHQLVMVIRNEYTLGHLGDLVIPEIEVFH